METVTDHASSVSINEENLDSWQEIWVDGGFMRAFPGRTTMRATFSYLSVLLFVAFAGSAKPREPQREDDARRVEARAFLNQGVQAFKAGQFDQAIEDFKRAKELDPLLTNAQLYLATAYASQYIPGAPSEENTHLGQQAIEEFKGVLDKDPNNLSAIDGIGAILYNMGGSPFDREEFNESKSYHRRHIKIRPDDPEPYYWIGAIDWRVAFHGNRELRSESLKSSRELRDAGPLPEQVRRQFSSEYGRDIDEGIEQLKKAIDLRSDYDDAMAYLSLLYRLKADTEPIQEQRDQDLRMADDLVDRVKAIKGQRMQMQQQPPD